MDLHTKISKLSKEELVELVLDLVESDEDIEKNVEFKLLTPNDEIKASKQVIRKYINENKWRGFISWRNVHAALQGAEMVLEKGRNKLVNGEEETAIRLGITVVSMVIDMLQYTDDSNGEIGYVISESTTLLKDASSMALLSTDHHVQEEMFELILKEAMHKRYDGWNDTRYELLDVCTIYSARSSAREKLEETLEKLLNKVLTVSSWTSDYDQQTIKELQLKILERNGEEDKAQRFISENMNFGEFRKRAIEKEMENGKYETALKVCEDGESNDSKYPGLVKEWKQYRLQIYEALEDIDKQKDVLLEFVYDNEYEAYGKLKDLYSSEEWQVVVEQIFDELENTSGYLPHVYEYIAKAENRADKILKWCNQSPAMIIELYPYLLDDYADKVDDIFTSYIDTLAEQASDRKEYRNVAQKLKIYKEACGESKFEERLHYLEELYQRKRAFVDELQKI
ncbi:DUF6880 family protein [Aquibacillus sediminis]|uniref:DUF6880 family protein n=1 Tax=Aquibacillus sediminis TaxID=2574734 RepID=UPI001109E030|nr:DUF6880 family protein [Aquibacillus sediminis]